MNNDRRRTKWHALARGISVTVVVLFGLLFIWFGVYLESIYKRKEAESLIVNLRGFPFSSAGFADVRDFVLSRGGHAVSGPLPFQPRVYGMAHYGSDGKTMVPFLLTHPVCTPRDCIFEIRITNAAEQIYYSHPSMKFLVRFCQLTGMHPWAVQAHFEVADGRLRSSRTFVGQIRDPLRDDSGGVPPLEYVVNTEAALDGTYLQYRIVVPHVTGPDEMILAAHVAQRDGALIKRAFDIHCSA